MNSNKNEIIKKNKHLQTFFFCAIFHTTPCIYIDTIETLVKSKICKRLI